MKSGLAGSAELGCSKGAEIAARVATLKPGDFVELDWPNPKQ
jgi:hypothetical protein